MTWGYARLIREIGFKRFLFGVAVVFVLVWVQRKVLDSYGLLDQHTRYYRDLKTISCLLGAIVGVFVFEYSGKLFRKKKGT